MPFPAVATWPPGAPPLLPLRPEWSPWLWLVVFVPLVGALVLRDRPLSRKVAATWALALVAPLAFFSARLFLAPPNRRLFTTGHLPWIEAGAFRAGLDLLLEPATALAALFVALVGAAAVLGQKHGRWLGALGAAQLAILSADLAMTILAWSVGFLVAAIAQRHTTGRSLRTLALGSVAIAALLAGAVLLAWGQLADSVAPLWKDSHLARLQSSTAVMELAHEASTPVPIGVEEAVALGDRTGAGAVALASDASLSYEALRLLTAAETTGMRAHLLEVTVGESQRSLLAVVTLLLVLAAALRLVQGAFDDAQLGWPLAAFSATTALLLLVRLAPVTAISVPARELLVMSGAALSLLGAGAGLLNAPPQKRLSWFSLVPCGIAVIVLGHSGASMALIALLLTGAAAALAQRSSPRLAIGLLLVAAVLPLALAHTPVRTLLESWLASSHAFPDRAVHHAVIELKLPLVLAGASVIALLAGLRRTRTEPLSNRLFGTRLAAAMDRLSRGLATVERYGLESALGFVAGLVRFIANVAAALDAMLLEKPGSKLADRLRRKSDHG